MRFFLNLVLVVIGVATAFSPSNIFAFTFNNFMKVGDRGNQVYELQKFLNTDSDTKLANFGPGSPGNETYYFGTITKDAVIRFQEKYKSEVLTPIGLFYGTGFAGEMTIKKLNKISNSNISAEPGVVETQTKSPVSLPSLPVTISPLENNLMNNPINSVGGSGFQGNNTPSKPITSKPEYVKIPVQNSDIPLELPLTWDPSAGEANPNLEDFDKTLSTVRKVGGEQGLLADEIRKVEDVLTAEVATTTNLKALFVKESIEANSLSVLPKQSFDNLFSNDKKSFTDKIASVFLDILFPKADAITSNFGGRIVTPILCTCSGNWLMTIIPYGIGPALLTHYVGAQAYLNFNVPFAMYVIGKYSSAGAPCLMYAGVTCVTIPSQGMTTPFMGSV